MLLVASTVVHKETCTHAREWMDPYPPPPNGWTQGHPVNEENRLVRRLHACPTCTPDAPARARRN